MVNICIKIVVYLYICRFDVYGSNIIVRSLIN